MLDATDQQYFQNLKHLWALFRETGEISPEVRPMIASSWMRSRDFHVDMMKPLRAPILSRPELQALQATNQTLIDLAKPIMEKMHSLVGKTKNLISLHNPDGYMLYSCGDEYYAEMKHESSFYWVFAGMNAISEQTELPWPCWKILPSRFMGPSIIVQPSMTGLVQPLRSMTEMEKLSVC